MPYDTTLANRVRALVAKQRGIAEREMFGGIAFLLEGKMFCGIVKRELMVRVGPERYRTALREPSARPMNFTGRPLLGYVFVQAKGLATERALRSWVERGRSFAASLQSPKKKRPASKTATKNKTKKKAKKAKTQSKKAPRKR